MQNNKAVVDKMVDILAQQYKNVLVKHGNKNASVDITGLSDKIVSILNEGLNDETQSKISNEITAFFDGRISSYDMRAGEIAQRAGISKKHEELMRDLRGLSGKFDKSCAEAIIKNIDVNNMQQPTGKNSNGIGTNKKSNKLIDIYNRGVLINPNIVNKDNINDYKKALENIKRLSAEEKPDKMLEDKILEETSKSRNTRRILVGNVADKDNNIMQDYDKMVAHYLLMEGKDPAKRFSKVEMYMKQYGLKPDLGVSIMKHGDNLTTKLEELAKQGKKSPQEWEEFKGQVLHSFSIAENIGNRDVNSQEHMMWEERLVRLGILERKLEKPTEQKTTLRESIKVDINDKDNNDKQSVATDKTMLERAQKAYIETGAIPIGYTKNEKGEIISIASKVGFDKNGTIARDKLSASKGNLFATKNTMQEQATR